MVTVSQLSKSQCCIHHLSVTEVRFLLEVTFIFIAKMLKVCWFFFFFGRLFLNSSSSQWSHPANIFKCFESKEPTCCVCGIMRPWFLSSLLSDTFPFQITQQGVNLFVALEPLNSPYFSVCFSLFIDLFYVLVRC